MTVFLRHISLLVAFLLIQETKYVFAQNVDSSNTLISVDTSIQYAFYDFAPDEPDSIIAMRMANVQASEIPFPFNSTVRSFIDYFSIRRRDYTRMVIQRKNAYFPIFEKYLKEYDLPDDLKYLTIVESAINPVAKSRVGALGLWQFMPATGKMFKLNYDYYYDERMDPHKSTIAACQYLKQLHGMFNDWEMALAAYNCGPGNVRRAIKRSGYKKGFWEIYDYLPRETRSYVPQFHAVKYVMIYANEHNLFVDEEEHLMECANIEISQYFNIEEFASFSNICLSDIQRLNPEIKRNVIPEHLSGYKLRIPVDKLPFYEEFKDSIHVIANKRGEEELTQKVVAVDYPTSSPTAGKEKIVHTVKSGDFLGKIAETYSVKLSDLRAWNNIGSNNVIRTGQKLYIYKDPSYFKKTTPAPAQDTAKINTPDDLKGKIHVVQPGDTLWSISQRYPGVTVEQIKKLNNLSGNNLQPGQKLKLG